MEEKEERTKAGKKVGGAKNGQKLNLAEYEGSALKLTGTKLRFGYGKLAEKESIIVTKAAAIAFLPDEIDRCLKCKPRHHYLQGFAMPSMRGHENPTGPVTPR